MSSWPASASSRAEALPECEPPRTTLGAPITVAMPAAREATRGFDAWSEIRRSRRRRCCASSTSSSVVSSWLASVTPCALAISTMRGRFSAARAAPTAGRSLGDFGEILGVAPGLAGVIDEIFLEIAELPLPRRVVHQRDQFARDGSQEFLEEVDDVRRRNLAAQMREMVRAQQAGGGRALCTASASGTTVSPRPLRDSYSSMPTRNESNTVVMPAAAICAS